jgi:uncharacterized membrane protein
VFSIGGFGIVMLFNVWGIIWPNNNQTIRRSTKERSSERPRQRRRAGAPNLPGLSHQFLPVGPLLFFMATSSTSYSSAAEETRSAAPPSEI